MKPWRRILYVYVSWKGESVPYVSIVKKMLLLMSSLEVVQGVQSIQMMEIGGGVRELSIRT